MIEGATKMPEPMTLPTMSVVASSRPRPRTSWAAGGVAAALWAKALEYNPAAPRNGHRATLYVRPVAAWSPGCTLRIQAVCFPRFPARAVDEQGRGAGQGPGLQLHGSQGPEADQALQARGQLPGGRAPPGREPALPRGDRGLPRGGGVPRGGRQPRAPGQHRAGGGVLPQGRRPQEGGPDPLRRGQAGQGRRTVPRKGKYPRRRAPVRRGGGLGQRSEEHTSELQSRSDLVCRLLLEKK